LHNHQIDPESVEDEDELNEKAHFTIDPDLWQKIGFQFMILSKKQSNEITIFRSEEDMGSSKSIRIYDSGDIEHLSINGESEVVKSVKIYPPRKRFCFF